jgi:hypothetical protein
VNPEFPLGQQAEELVGNTFIGDFCVVNQRLQGILDPIPGVVEGGPATLRASVIEPGGIVIDQDTRAVKINMTSGIPFLQQLVQNHTTSGGGFTQSDRDTIQVTQQSVLKGFPGLPDFPITELLLHPPLGLLKTELITPDRTDVGQLERTNQADALRTFGLLVDLVSWPPGMTIEFGAPNHVLGPSILFNGKALELNVVHQLVDQMVVSSDRAVITQGQSLYLFKEALPSRVEYNIVPGVTVRFHWIVTTAP